MRMLQILVFKLLSFLVLLLGLLLLAELWTDVFPPIIERATTAFTGWSEWLQKLVWIIGGLALVAIGLIGLLPAMRRRRGGRQISFAGPHGDVSIQLDSVEATLNRVVSKMPEVNKITARVLPADENRKVEIAADVVLNKLPGIGAREIARRVSNQIRNTAVHILGVDEVTNIKLDVSRIVVDLKKPMEIPEDTAAMASAGLGASAVGMGPVTTIEGVEEAEREVAESRGAGEAPGPEPADFPPDEVPPPDSEDEAVAPPLETLTAAPEAPKTETSSSPGLIDDEPEQPAERDLLMEQYGEPISQERVEADESESSPWEQPFKPEERSPFDAERRRAEADEPLPPLDELAEEEQVSYLPESEEASALPPAAEEPALPLAEEEPLLPLPEQPEDNDEEPREDLPR